MAATTGDLRCAIDPVPPLAPSAPALPPSPASRLPAGAHLGAGRRWQLEDGTGSAGPRWALQPVAGALRFPLSYWSPCSPGQWDPGTLPRPSLHHMPVATAAGAGAAACRH